MWNSVKLLLFDNSRPALFTIELYRLVGTPRLGRPWHRLRVRNRTLNPHWLIDYGVLKLLWIPSFELNEFRATRSLSRFSSKAYKMFKELHSCVMSNNCNVIVVQCRAVSCQISALIHRPMVNYIMAYKSSAVFQSVARI